MGLSICQSIWQTNPNINSLSMSRMVELPNLLRRNDWNVWNILNTEMSSAGSYFLNRATTTLAKATIKWKRNKRPLGFSALPSCPFRGATEIGSILPTTRKSYYGCLTPGSTGRFTLSITNLYSSTTFYNYDGWRFNKASVQPTDDIFDNALALYLYKKGMYPRFRRWIFICWEEFSSVNCLDLM